MTGAGRLRSCLTRTAAALAAMWGLRGTVVKAAGVAAVALGAHAVRWLTRRKGDEDDSSPVSTVENSPDSTPAPKLQVPKLDLSPFEQASVEYVPQDAGPSATSSSECATEKKPVEKVLRFQEPESSDGEGSLRYRGSSSEEDQASEYSDAGGSSDLEAEADGHASIQTPATAKSPRAFGSILSPRYSFPRIDYEPDTSPFDLSSPTKRQQSGPDGSSLDSPNGHADGLSASGRHSRHPSFPVVDYEPEHKGFYASSQADSLDMAPAPTEEGDALARVEDVLAELEQLGESVPRRHSRSYSEPNLTVHSAQLQDQDGRLGHHDSSEEEDEAESSARQLQARDLVERSADGASSSGLAAASNGNRHEDYDSSASGSKRLREDSFETAPLLRIDILAGPFSGQDMTIDNPSAQVTIGRLPDNHLYIEDIEISGRHVMLQWDCSSRCWQASDLGTLNGTLLNGTFISLANRMPGKRHRLNTDDILQLGGRTALKMVYLPNTSAAGEVPRNLRRVAAPPSLLLPTSTMRSEALATLRAEVGIEKAFQAHSLRLEGAVLCTVGTEHQRHGTPCEDVPFWGDPGRFGAGLYCVFDGHCGRTTASKCTELLPEELRKRMPEIRPLLDTAEGAGKIWEDVFLAVDSALDTEDGATATALLVWKDAEGNLCLQTANVGDSAAVFCKSDRNPREEFQKLTADHRISDPDEKQRLADLGIELGRNRTRLYGLNLSRCLGDKFIKGADLGFTAVPYVSNVAKLAPHESGTVVIASDGLWDVSEPGRVMEVAFEAQGHPNSNSETVADAVYQHALRQRTKDDVCVFVLQFSPEGTVTAGQSSNSKQE